MRIDESCPICTSRIPELCKTSTKQRIDGEPVRTNHMFCPACGSGFEQIIKGGGSGDFGASIPRRMGPGDEIYDALKRQFEHMTQDALAPDIQSQLQRQS